MYGIQARGLDEDRPLPQSLEDMARGYVDEILSIHIDGPYRLLGWSLGGTIAHAMAIELQNRGYQVEFLAMFDSTPFPTPVDREESDNGEFEGSESMLRAILEAFGAPAGTLGVSPTTEEVVEVMQRGIGTLGSLRPEQMQRVLEVALNSARVCGLPRSVGRVSGDLHFYSADGDDGRDPSDAAQLWAEYFSGRVHTYRIDCAHGDMMSAEPLAAIAATLVASVRELDGNRHEESV